MVSIDLQVGLCACWILHPLRGFTGTSHNMMTRREKTRPDAASQGGIVKDLGDRLGGLVDAQLKKGGEQVKCMFLSLGQDATLVNVVPK